MNKLLITAGLILVFLNGFTQEKKNADESYPRFNGGVGLGIDYGGIGVRLTFLPVKQAFLFGGLGYNIVGLGYNVGGGFRFSPEKKTCPYVIAMYGYNAAMLVFVNGDYLKQYNKTFYGPSAGFGLELGSRKVAKNYFNLELLYLFRSKAFKDYKRELENNLNATFISLPVSFSVGYHIGF